MYRGRNEEQWRGPFIFEGVVGMALGMTLHIFRTTFALFIEAAPQSKMSFKLTVYTFSSLSIKIHVT